MKMNIDIIKEKEFDNIILSNMCYDEKYAIAKKEIERLESCREIFVNDKDKKIYSKYCKRIVLLRRALSYYEHNASVTELRSKYNI